MDHATLLNASVNILTTSVIPSAVLSLVGTAVLTSFLYHVYQDYLAFISLGPGGTPSTAAGYLRIKVLGLFALHDRYSPAIPDFREGHAGKAYLSGLPKRERPRPVVYGIAPQRQMTQRIDQEMFAKLRTTMMGMAGTYRGLAIGTSCFEKNGVGLFSASPKVRTCLGEVCHAHAIDGSLHMTLHPADARVVLEAGWGERHPLSRGGWFERFVPRDFVLVYSPCHEGDLATIAQIIRAAVWHVGGDVGPATADDLQSLDMQADAAFGPCRIKDICVRPPRRMPEVGSL